MKVSVLDSAGQHAEALRDLFAWADCVDLACAWATASGGNARHWRAMDLSKLRRAIIGVEFAQTEPWVLRKLDEKPDRLRVALRCAGTFHPKVYVGSKGSRVRAIVGSANFTHAAFSNNVEFGVQLEGTAGDVQIDQLQAFIESQWNLGDVLDPSWLSDYEIAWEARKRVRIVIPRTKLDVTLAGLDMTWAEYFALLKAQEGRTLASGYRISVFGPGPESYAAELDLAERCLLDERKEHRKFGANLPYESRQALIGMGASSGLLGTMRAAGRAKQVVNNEPELIGVHLDRIPSSGKVDSKLAESVVRSIMGIKGVKIGVTSRLLAVKRPDVFVSVNNGSNPQLAKLLHQNEVKSADHYLKLLETVWATSWYASPQPTDSVEEKAWSRRAAMLDAVLYEQV